MTRSLSGRGDKGYLKMADTYIAQHQYQELLQTCVELFHIAKLSLSRRDVQWYAHTLDGCWDSNHQSWEHYLADCAEYM
jgi:hypothetical protein